MATSSGLNRRWTRALAAAGLLGAVVVSLAAGLGSPGSRVNARSTRAAGPRLTGAFSWLSPTAAPRTWTRATIASGGATLFYPSNWKQIPGDSGTVTAALRDTAGRYLGYLNVTPREGAERLAGWAAFRKARNIDEGDTQLRVLASGEHLRFANATGSCVIDDYRSRVGSHAYREIACIVAGRRFTSVLVAATLLSDWPTLGGVVERAASAFAERENSAPPARQRRR
jgi:hypothetical protein